MAPRGHWPANAHILQDAGLQGPLLAKLVLALPRSGTSYQQEAGRLCCLPQRCTMTCHLPSSITVQSSVKHLLTYRRTHKEWVCSSWGGNCLRDHLQFGSTSFDLLWKFKWSPYIHPPPKYPTLATEGSAMRHQIDPCSGLRLYLFAPFQTSSLFLLPKIKWIP